jgi:hypothetical protein
MRVGGFGVGDKGLRLGIRVGGLGVGNRGFEEWASGVVCTGRYRSSRRKEALPSAAPRLTHCPALGFRGWGLGFGVEG